MSLSKDKTEVDKNVENDGGDGSNDDDDDDGGRGKHGGEARGRRKGKEGEIYYMDISIYTDHLYLISISGGLYPFLEVYPQNI